MVIGDMKNQYFYVIKRFAGVASCAFLMAAMTNGCGGGAVIPQSVAGPSSIAGTQEEPNNNLFVMPPGHPNKIIFQSQLNTTKNGDAFKIYSMNLDGSMKTVVAEMPTLKDHTEPRKWEYRTPAVTSDGLSVYYSVDYFDVVTSILSSPINGAKQTVVKKYGDIYLEDPAVSWDGKKLAFVGYTANLVTIAVPEDEILVDMPPPQSQTTLFTAAAQLALHPSGYKMTTNAYVDENGSTGMMQLKQNDPTTCPADGETYKDYNNADATADYVGDVNIAGLGKIQYTNIVGNYYCINLDDENYILFQVTDFLYPITKDLKKSCTASTDCTGGADCGSAGRCVDKSGAITYDLCSNGSDCETGVCNTEKLCALDDDSGLASITIEWTWIQKNYSDTTTMTEKYDEDTSYGTIRWGAGMNFIGELTNKRMDLYTMDVDGGNFVQHTDDIDADRFPCFSPASSSYVYYTNAVLDEGSQNVDKPVSSNIKKLNISTGDTETILNPTYLIKGCTFSPSGKTMLYSAKVADDYDLYAYDVTTMASSFFFNTGGNDVEPTFSPDGKYVAFQSDYMGDEDIYVTDITTTNAVNLTYDLTKDTDDMYPAWTP